MKTVPAVASDPPAVADALAEVTDSPQPKPAPAKTSLPGGRAAKRSFISKPGSDEESWIRVVFAVCGISSLVIMALIMLFLFKEGLGLFAEVNPIDFIFGRFWYPTYDPADFGILPLILGSVSVTVVSSAIAVPLGVGTALYLAEVASPRMREIAKPVVELLASLPSVVLGFVGMVVLAPLLQEWLDIPTGLNVLNASLMLALMAIPTITSISEDALAMVPRELREGSLALGATRWETLRHVLVPASLSGIGTGVILGMSRAMGETMVVLMVAGGAAQIPTSLFESVRPMPATIAAEMGETPFGSTHYHALFAIGIVLFLMTLGFNLLSQWLSRRYTQRGEASL